MHFHLPKPLHGWREFAGEVGVIVLGVVIALALEQVAEAISWNIRAREARTALRAEVGHGFVVAEERQAVAPCVDEQLRRVEAAIVNSGLQMKPIPIHADVFRYVVRAPARSWADSAWQGVIAEGTTPHLTDREREHLPIYYSQMQTVRMLGDAETAVLGDLLALSQPLRLDPQVQASFIRELEGERARNQAITTIDAQMMNRVERVGYVPGQKERLDWLNKSGTLKFCREQHLPLR